VQNVLPLVRSIHVRGLNFAHQVTDRYDNLPTVTKTQCELAQIVAESFAEALIYP
jgi:hypothetical protein